MGVGFIIKLRQAENKPVFDRGFARTLDRKEQAQNCFALEANGYALYN